MCSATFGYAPLEVTFGLVEQKNLSSSYFGNRAMDTRTMNSVYGGGEGGRTAADNREVSLGL